MGKFEKFWEILRHVYILLGVLAVTVGTIGLVKKGDGFTAVMLLGILLVLINWK